MIRLAAALAASCLVGTSAGAQITGRTVPAPVYGVTFDDVSNVAREVRALRALVKFPTVRVVFDRGTEASRYVGPIEQLRPVAYVMGELIDSSYAMSYTVDQVRSWTDDYATTLGSSVDVWEVGNEVNGDWLGPDVMAKVEAAYDVVASKGGKTALTFFYEGEVGRKNCVDSQGGMFPWIARNFTGDAESEKVRLNVDYALISWYPSQCKGVNPDWPAVYAKLASIFPNSKVGFGELGTPKPQRGSSYEKNLMTTYYPLARSGLPASYVGGYFWWYAAEELVPWPGSLGAALNAALSAGP